MRPFHRIAHWLGWNRGMVETWWTHGYLQHPDNRLMVGFRCDGCGKLSRVHDESYMRQHITPLKAQGDLARQEDRGIERTK